MAVNSKPFFPTTRDLPPTLFRRLADSILNLIYPERCFICSQPVARVQDRAVCQDCWERVLQLRITPPWCPSCGLPYQQFDAGATHLCGRCSLQLPSYSGVRSFGYYRGELSSLIRGLKFEGRKNLVGLIAPLLASSLLESWDRKEIDLVIPMPLHPKRKRERGFNQAALLGRALARLVAVPYCESALARIRHTPPQVGLSDAERLRNVGQAFRCVSPRVVAQQRVLLVDDVMTTGATAASASETLMEAGALRVSIMTVARSVPGVE